MKPLLRLLTVPAVFVGLAAVAHAGPVGDFEGNLRAAYADYRSALFFTNTSDPDKASSAIDGFQEKWSALANDNAGAPPQYADDPDYAATLAAVAGIADTAAGEVAAGKLGEAHETLEAIRDQIGHLHERNGIVTFSDRMNAYHAEMERVLGSDYGTFDAEALGRLREDAAILAYLADDIVAHPPAGAPADPAFVAALKPFEASVMALRQAARSGDAAAARKAVGGLKGPYSKLFLKFG
ncbi:MAG: hypothetical protein RLT05_09690 [Bauldia litoralis]